ncbi:MAG: DUF2063 domain-containing protein [Confluentimicrobium sp.]|nr:DUF2063 domain-containing protein [Actibacterium sp.]
MPSHPDMQDAFRRAVAGGALPPDLTAPGDVERRFAVYRNNVFHSLTQALRTRFPVVEQLVGAEYFGALARNFVTDHPPDDPVLARYGARLPDYLAAQAELGKLGYLADVARLELARGAAYHAADAEPVNPACLADAAAQSPETLRLILHPSLRCLVSRWPVLSLWRAHQPGGDIKSVPATAEAVLICRPQDRVDLHAVSPHAAALIADLAAGETLGAVAERAAAQGRDSDLTAALGIIIQHRLLVGLSRVTVSAPHPQGEPS